MWHRQSLAPSEVEGCLCASFLVGAQHAVPGTNPWRGAADSAIAPAGDFLRAVLRFALTQKGSEQRESRDLLSRGADTLACANTASFLVGARQKGPPRSMASRAWGISRARQTCLAPRRPFEAALGLCSGRLSGGHASASRPCNPQSQRSASELSLPCRRKPL